MSSENNCPSRGSAPSPTPSTTRGNCLRLEPPPQGAERRTTPRYTVELPVRYATMQLEVGNGQVESHSKPEIEGRVADVSWGGLFIRSASLETVGTPVSLLVTLPQRADPVPLRGQVAWVTDNGPKGPGMGIRLVAPL